METKTKVERMFKYYGEQKQNLDILKFQITSFSGTSDEQVIEALNYAVPDGERVSTSSIADKSARIAMIYRDIADRESQDILQGMVKKYFMLKNELDVFDYCLTLLEPRLSGIIMDIVCNTMTWGDAAEKYNVSISMIGHYRKTAIKQLTKMLEPSLLFNPVEEGLRKNSVILE